MDDGTKASNVTYNLYTCAFTAEEHEILIEILLIKFNIQAKLKFDYHKKQNKSYPYITITKRYSTNNSHLIFKDLISPYIIDSMKYKL